MLTRSKGVPYLRWLSGDEAPAESQQLEREGWVLLPEVFSEEEIAALSADVTRVFDELPPDHRRPDRDLAEATQFRYEMLNRSATCQKMIANRRILEVIEPLVGEDCHVIANTAWRNPPDTVHTHGGGRWHIDAGPHVPLPPGVAWDERIPHPVFVVACHILLWDCPAACGPTGVIPRSHLSGQHPPLERIDDPTLTWEGIEPVVLEARAGGVQLFVSDVWHRRMPTAPGDEGRFFLQVHYGRRDIAQRLQTTDAANQVSVDARNRASSERERTLIGLHEPVFYDG